MARAMTKLRRIFIIETLLDGNEWHTQEILKKIGHLEYIYYIRSQQNFRPEKIEPVNDAKLSNILGNLVIEGIIGTRALSRFEKKGTRSKGNVYWFVKSIKTLYKLLNELNDPQIPESMHNDINNLKFYLMSSEYGQNLINRNMVEEIEPKILNKILKEKERKFILATLKISPTALYNLLKAYYIKNHYWQKYLSKSSNNNEQIQLFWKEKFFMDLKFWLYNDIHGAPHFGKDTKVIFDVSVFIKLNNKEVKDHSRRESIDYSEILSIDEFLEDFDLPRQDFEKRWVEMGDESYNDELMTANRGLYDARDNLIERNRELEDNKEDLQRKIYKDLRLLSERKLEKKKKIKNKEKLIEEYYFELNKLEKK